EELEIGLGHRALGAAAQAVAAIRRLAHAGDGTRPLRAGSWRNPPSASRRIGGSALREPPQRLLAAGGDRVAVREQEDVEVEVQQPAGGGAQRVLGLPGLVLVFGGGRAQ